MSETSRNISKPHSVMGVPEAQKIIRLLSQDSAAATGELQRMGIAAGLCTMETDAASTRRRMKQAAENAIRWHGDK